MTTRIMGRDKYNQFNIVRFDFFFDLLEINLKRFFFSFQLYLYTSSLKNFGLNQKTIISWTKKQNVVSRLS